MATLTRTPAIFDDTEPNDRQIYNGNVIADPQGTAPSYAIRPNKKAVKRKHSTFNIVGALFLLAIASLLYTSNVIAVNQLAKEVNDLTNRYNSIVSANEVLKAEINRKSSLDRIGSLASGLGMTNPKEAPVWIEIDHDKVDELRGK